MVLSGNAMRLIGLQSLDPVQELLLGLGINTTLTRCHTAGTQPVTRQAWKILTRLGTTILHHSCNTAGNMPSIPGLLHWANELIARSTLPWVTTSVATCQSHHLAQWAAAQAAISSVTTELGK